MTTQPDNFIEEKKHQIKIRVARLLGYVQQIQDSGQAHCATLELEGILKEVENFEKTLSQAIAHGEEKEVCVCAAVKASDGTIYRGHRHGHAMQACRDEGKVLLKGADQQGFITTRNRYVNREEGRRLQDEAGIPSADKEGYRGITLFSEDLYQPDKDSVITPSKKDDV